ncbi:hypothetical protein [Kitasatospora sp. McL0602]|uniref:hypothetical protein n=1 Tax=Kitasatospora sp. McL0602 TaxID=3439530 RepID=UPI003F8BE8BC
MSTSNPVARRATILITSHLGEHTAAAVVEALDRAGMLARPTERVGGPYPISLRRTGLGVELDHHSLMSALLIQYVTSLAEDPSGVLAEAEAITAASGPERDALIETLLDSLGGTTQALGATAAKRLAERITALAGPVFPEHTKRQAS